MQVEYSKISSIIQIQEERNNITFCQKKKNVTSQQRFINNTTFIKGLRLSQ